MSFLFFCRRYSQDNNYYYSNPEKYMLGRRAGPTSELPGWENPDGEADAIPVHLFQKHVAEMHLDQVVIFLL